MVCNHCTMVIPRGMFVYRTTPGYVCQLCRDEITAAIGEVATDDLTYEDDQED